MIVLSFLVLTSVAAFWIFFTIISTDLEESKQYRSKYFWKIVFFFPLSCIRRYQHTVMNTSLDVVAKILDHCWSQVWDMQRRTIHHDILRYKRFFWGGETRNRKGLRSDFRAKRSGEATHWPLTQVGKLWQEVTALLSFERCSIIHFPFSSPFLPPFTPWLSHPLPATSPPPAAGP